MEKESQDLWFSLCQRLKPQCDLAKAGELLIARYREPHRAYHNLEHIRECLTQLAIWHSLALQPEVIELAIWFHDAVYVPGAVDNEEQSAELALSFCCLAKLPPQVADRTAALILLTKHQLPVDDTDGQLLVDIDLSILGQDPERFARYENAIRQEYAAVSETAFRDGRAAVLRKFFERDFIFHTSAFRDLYEESARANLRWSLSRLTSVA